MKPLAYKGLISTILIGSLAACASTPSAYTSRAERAQASSSPAGCVASTGTHLSRRAADCAGYGHTWTRDQLRTTGQIDPAQALGELDPSLSVQHH